MKEIELATTPNIHPRTAFKILAEGEESLPPKTKLKLLAERMKQRMREASRQDDGLINFATYKSSRAVVSKNGTSQMMPPSGKDNYGSDAPLLARREMI